MSKYKAFRVAVVLSIIAFSLVGCSSNTMKLTCDLSSVLKSYEEGATVDSVVVQICSPDGVYSNIGIAVIDGNKAAFSTQVDSPALGRVMYCLTVPGGTGSSVVPFVAEPGTITIGDKSIAYGSISNDAIIEALGKIGACSDDLVAINKVFSNFASKYDNAALVLLCVKSYRLIYNELWMSVLDSMGEEISGNSEINKYRALAQKSMKAKNATAPGAKYSDFKGEWNGQEYVLSDFVNQGNYVLVDFWASWCMPCRKEIPYIIRANDKYKNKGLTVIGVAVSDKPEDTASAVKSLGINYTVFNEIDNSATKAYGIQFIPQILLIGPDGSIIANDLRGEDIVDTIGQYLD